MIAILIAVAIILLVSAIVWARSRKRRTEEPAQIDEAVAGTGAAGTAAGTAAGAASVGGAASAGRATVAAPDLLTSADQITDDEINAGRTAALRKILEERGRE